MLSSWFRRFDPRSNHVREEILVGPIRGELLGADHLGARARAAASAQWIARKDRPWRSAPLLDRLNATRRVLGLARKRLAEHAADGGDMSPAGEWLLDNFYLIQEQMEEVRASLPSGYYRELPERVGGPLSGYPRVYEIAITLISHTESRVDLENVTRFVSEFQQVAPLSMGELWAVPAMLRLALIESVRRMTLRTVERLDELDRADHWYRRMRNATGVEVGVVLSDFVAGHPPLTATFVSRLLQLLHADAVSAVGLERLEEWLTQEGHSAESSAAQSIQRVALTQLMMTNSITSLRALARWDWRDFVEGQSRTEAILRTDPAGTYAAMTFATRDRYRHAVERIAKAGNFDEEAVAKAAIASATGEATGSRQNHVGYHLIDKGVRDLEKLAGYRSGVREQVIRTIELAPDGIYLGGIGLVTVALLSWLPRAFDLPSWMGAVLTVLAFLPGLDLAVRIVNHLVPMVLPPRMLPRLDFRKDGVPVDCRTAVVIPILLEDVEAARRVLETIEIRFLANREANVHFAILSDFTDAPTEHRPDDDEIVATARSGIETLNARYAEGRDDIFYLLHRPRLWNPSQGVWMGWERKRGKLAEFNQFIRGRATGAFSEVVGDATRLRDVRYVITLDADTVLPPDAAPDLIGAIAHPLNRGRYDERRGRVVEGYGILQPHVGISLPSACESPFAAASSGPPGVDPYTTAVSDVYQDLYAEGSFTGKGIYDVDLFERATHGRFPENRLLSHDLIEGNYARTGLVTDVNLFDDFPATYLAYTRRKHRWVRGDWQLVQWLSSWVPGPEGIEPNRLSLVSRWKIFDNLRRSLLEIAQLALFVAGWLWLPGSPIGWTLFAIGIVAAPWLLATVVALLRTPLDRTWRGYLGAVGADAVRSVQQIGIALAFLPHQAWSSVDAIVRTLWRMIFSKRRLLEWQTASAVERSQSGRAGEAWRAMAPAVGLAAIIAIPVLLRLSSESGSAIGMHLGVVAFPLLLLWLLSPVLQGPLGPTEGKDAPVLSPDARAQAARYALLHWKFFDRFVTAETSWLAPDNHQDDPEPVTAMRTSPTNIGLQLISTVSAHDLGFIPLEDMLTRLEQTFASLDRMPRFRGHFYNWYDVANLSPLPPPYISTVDSGNLAGHLIALRQACNGLADQLPSGPPPTSPTSEVAGDVASRLVALGERAYRMALEMDFGFLYDPERKLFSIGYQVQAHALDASSYDLLASEARLASFMAIAKNDVPAEHWFRLGRRLSDGSGPPVAVSWSGSMFEYLMPNLVMQSFPFTMLDQTGRGAIRRQIAYATKRGVPWGISESAFNGRDSHATYQYRAFGVPDLALKRGLSRDLVVAPYASALAAQLEPMAALRNLSVLEGLGLLGPYGFRDAIDYTRPAPDSDHAVVANYMSHHVGMSLVALTNVLTDGLWQRRFHADPLVRSVDLLLHERVPRRGPAREPIVGPGDERRAIADADAPVSRQVDSPDGAMPHVALLGRPPLTVMVSHCGGGYSRFQDLAIVRWRSDGTSHDTGQFCYLKDLTTGRYWSAAHQPTGVVADRYRATLAVDRVTFQRADGDLETKTEIAVVPDDAAEVRRITVSNNGSEPREVELTSYGEIVIAPPDSDRAHPAFGNLFVETEWHEWCTAVTAVRRARTPSDPKLWCVHVVDSGPDRVGATSCETDRDRFQGRGRSRRNPVALVEDGPLSGTTGPVLDPIFALRVRVLVPPGHSVPVTFTTLIATSRERAFELAGRYHDPHAAQRAFDLAWTSSQVELRELGLTAGEATAFQELAGPLFFGAPGARPVRRPAPARGIQERLWSMGISGDWPMAVATISSMDGISTLRQMVAAHRYWRRRGMTVDLVILNAHPTTYQADLEVEIAAIIATTNQTAIVDRPGGIFLRRRDLLDPEDVALLGSIARLAIDCDGRDLARIARSLTPVDPSEAETAVRPRRAERSNVLRRIPWRLLPELLGAVDPEAETEEAAVAAAPAGPAPDFPNGFGRLDDRDDYEIEVGPGRVPPAPWVNVIANARGGFIVSERGGGFTWAENSYFFRLTPWHNDPIADPPTEVVYLRDEDTGDVWCPTPAPIDSAGRYRIRHAPGKTTFSHQHRGIVTELAVGMVDDQPIKASILRVTNQGERRRRLSVTSYVEWTLGVLREHTRHHVETAFGSDLRTIFARNPFDARYSSWTAFHSISEPVRAYTADRREFLGRNGALGDPAALRRTTDGVGLSGATGIGSDPCSALQCELELAPGETKTLVVLLGGLPSMAEAEAAIASALDPARTATAVDASAAAWDHRLSQIVVKTPDPTFDAMMNRWMLYQTLACRFWARSATYQSSGAYGFRDQLQDVMALVYAEPHLAREHILRATARQFVQGDVQHWWHPETGRGTRTRFSDDLVWLPYVVAHYVRTTGDHGVLDEMVPFLSMRELGPDDHEVYDLPQSTVETASVYEHCLLALRRAATAGPHGIPLIGGGDWNDGMNRVGAGGTGESIWLGWFLVSTMRTFAELVDGRSDPATARALREHADRYVTAVETHGWDGDWYRRAYFDDGTPLGTAAALECRIDSIAQSWSVISGGGSPERQRRAMASLERHLVRPESRLIQLLDPPFDHLDHDPGYIKGYLPGVRENGAQYTHGALWAVLATALLRDGDRAFELFQMLNPLSHGATADDVAKYKVEPYVVAADVYTATGNLGRGGWTWYTGSASWMYRVGLEGLLGMTKRGNELRFAPSVPTSWPQFSVDYRFGGSVYSITIREPGNLRSGGVRVTVDGKIADGSVVRMVDDGARHAVTIEPEASIP